MLGPAVRAVAGVPQDRLNTIEKLAKRLSYGKPDVRPHGEVWDAYLRKIITDGLPVWAHLLDVKADVLEIGEFTVRYDDPIATKHNIATNRHAIVFGRNFQLRNSLSRGGAFAPVRRKGSVTYKASAVSFNKPLSSSALEEWSRQNKKVLAGSEEAIDLVLSLPVLKFAPSIPLAMFGERFWDTFEYSYRPVLHEHDGRLTLDLFRHDEGGKSPTLWSEGSKFLILEEVQQV
jgi:hypothetical protein